MLALVLVVATLAVAGCGSGGGNSTASTATTVAGAAPTASQTAPPPSQTAPSQTAPSQAPGTSNPAPAAKPAVSVARKADAICGRRNLELAAATSKTPSLSVVASVARHRIAIERAELAELGKLTPSPAIAGDWREFIAAANQAVQDLTQVVAAATHGELGLVNTAGHLYAGAVNESHAAAKLAVLGRCGE